MARRHVVLLEDAGLLERAAPPDLAARLRLGCAPGCLLFVGQGGLTLTNEIASILYSELRTGLTQAVQLLKGVAHVLSWSVRDIASMIKSAYAVIKGIKKKFVPEVVDSLLDDWLGKLQPHYEKWLAAKQSSFADYLVSRLMTVVA